MVKPDRIPNSSCTIRKLPETAVISVCRDRRRIKITWMLPTDKDKMTIIVHHLDRSRSHRIIWLLEELGVPYEIKEYKRNETMLAPPELKKVHPLGKSPVIENTETQDIIAESGAIVEACP